MSKRPKISACLIVKDEASFIQECLTRLWKAVDEIVVLDTGSTDETVDIASRMDARVFHHPWREDFSEARNAALAHATHPWIFVIDADEYLDLSTIEHLDQLQTEQADGYLIDVVNFHDDDNQRVITKHLALFRNREDFRYEGAIHENIANSIAWQGGTIGYLPIRVVHLGYSQDVRQTKRKGERNLAIIRRELKRRPDDILLNYYLAQEFFVHGALEDAVKYYRRALWRTPPRGGTFVPGAAVRLMVALWRLARWDEAYEVLERYQTEYLDYTDLHFLDGVFSRKLGNYQRAEGALLRALALGDSPSSRYEQVHAGFGTYRAWTELGELYQELGQDKEAFSAYTSALRSNPQYSYAVSRLARLALEYDSPSDVLSYLGSVADLEDARCASEAWEVFFSARGWNECQSVASVLPEKERGFKSALISVGQSRFDEAAKLLLDIAMCGDENTESGRASVVTGVLLAAELGDRNLGAHFLSHLAVTEEPGLRATLSDLVTVLSRSDAHAPMLWSTQVPHAVKEQQAWNLVARSIRLGLTVALEQVGLLLSFYGASIGDRALKFGRILQREGFDDAAVEQYLRAGLHGVFDADSLLAVVKYAIRSDQAAEGIALLEKAIDLDPARPLPYLLLARALRSGGQNDRAREVLEKGLQRNPYASLLVSELKLSATGPDRNRQVAQPITRRDSR